MHGSSWVWGKNGPGKDRNRHRDKQVSKTGIERVLETGIRRVLETGIKGYLKQG